MARTCFVSFKTEDTSYKKYIQENLKIDMIDKSLNKAIESDNPDYIMRKIREDYLSNSTITIHLIGAYSAENKGAKEQHYIKRELQASLYNSSGNTRNGILGVVLPEVTDDVYKGSCVCSVCGGNHDTVDVSDKTTITEFNYNYYIPNEKCAHSEEDRYCVLVKWSDFCKNPETYIEEAFKKRSSSIADKVKVYPKN